MNNKGEIITDLSLSTQMKLLPVIPTDVHKMLERQRNRDATGADYMENALTRALESSYKKFPMRHRTAAEDDRRIGLMTRYIKIWLDNDYPSSRAIETLESGLQVMMENKNFEFSCGEMWVTENSGITHKLSDYECRTIGES